MLETGIPNLDRILGGGVPEGDVLLVVGPAGTGKTTLSLQMAFHLAGIGKPALYASTLSEAPNRLIKHTKGFSFYDERLLGRALFLLNIYPLVKQNLENVGEALTKAAKEHGARLLVLDGLMTLRELHPDTPELRIFLYDLAATLATLDCTTVLTSSRTEASTQPEPFGFTMADGIVELGRQNVGARTLRTIRASKMRGLAPLLGEHSLRIDGDGMAAFPRIESLYLPGDVGLSTDRVPLGLVELDDMMHGGPPAGSATVLAGALGTGKTLTCIHYIMEGVARGERGLIAGFRETPRQLMDKARAFGLELEEAVRDGSVAIFHRAAVDLILDEVTFELRSEVERFAPQRLALDSVVELEYAIFDDRRRRGYVTVLSDFLRAEGVTPLFTVETPQVTGPELDFSRTTMAVLSENLLMFRTVEFRGELVGIVSVLKMRDSAYDSSIRQYAVTDQGVTVVPRDEMAAGVLAAIARLPGEVRMRSGRRGEERA